MPKVTAVTHIIHDGVSYPAGESFYCTRAQAEQLVALGSAMLAGKKVATAETGEPPAQPFPATKVPGKKKPKGGG